MMDLHSDQHGYEEILPPYIVNRDSLYRNRTASEVRRGSVQASKDTDYYLIPTAEVPVTNYHREEILTAEICRSILWHTAHVSVLKQVLRKRYARAYSSASIQ